MDARRNIGKRPLLIVTRSHLILSAGIILLALASMALVQAESRRVRSERLWTGQLAYGALRFGIDPGIVPFSFYDESGWNGMDAELAHEIADRLGLRVESDPVGYDALYDALFVGRVDVGISALVLDATRSNDALFTTGYFESGLTALSLASRHEPPTSGSLANSRIAAALGSDGDVEIRKLQQSAIKTLRLNTGSAGAAVQLVRTGAADFALVDGLDAIKFLSPELQTTVIHSDQYVLAVRPDQIRLKDQLNGALESMRKDGTLDRLIARWLVGRS